MDRQTGVSTAYNPPETNSTVTRVTKSGKTLRYDLRIIQQPERARACGAGAKASSDRRPVDPPPILQLQIYEVLPNGSEHDVTSTMHANFFIYALLDRARVIAQPRNVVADASKQHINLTGSAVAGMQPFDRPHPAIYFIFPDLSVRHEGRYRLLFSLFENIRRVEDDDRHVDSTVGSLMSGNMASSTHVHRMDVRSLPFDVYSAKRFPGLNESTSLSRTFAEQGSRIRIRRDVRMRRRDTKQSKEWEDFEDECSQINRLSQTPDPYGHQQVGRQSLDVVARPQSSSSSAQNVMQTSSRRTSLNDLSQSYHQQQTTAQHNGFAQPTYNTSPNQTYTQASFMHPPPPQFPQNGYQTAQVSMPTAQQHVNYYGYVPQPNMSAPQPQAQQTQQQHHQASQYPPISTSFDANAYQARSFAEYPNFSNDSRRTSIGNQQLFTPQTQTPMSAFPSQTMQQSLPTDQHAQLNSQHNVAATQAPPPEPLQPPTRVTTPNPPSLNAKNSFNTTTLPPLSTSFVNNKIEAASPSSAAPMSGYTNPLPTPTESHKRSYASTFPTSWQNMANKQGARPNDAMPASMFLQADADGDDVADPTDNITRFYRRAGGRILERQIP